MESRFSTYDKAIAAFVVVKVFTVQNVVVEGNSLYSADQIKNMVLNDDYSWNSLYVDLKYRFVDVGEVPFVDKNDYSNHGVARSIVMRRFSIAASIAALLAGGAYVYFPEYLRF